MLIPAKHAAHKSPYTFGGIDLRDRAARVDLHPRDDPHWTILYRGCHLGYRPSHSGEKAHWYARIANTLGRRFRSRLGEVDDGVEADGVSILDFDQAREKAIEWFETNVGSSCRDNPGKLQSVTGLIYYPTCSEMTVAHALIDLLEWKRTAAASGHYHVVVSLINCHILPRIGSMLVDDVTAKHIRALAHDVIENPTHPVKGIAKLPTRIAEMDEETLRRRRKSANAVITILKQAFFTAWEDEKTNNQRAWRACRSFQRVSRARACHLSRTEVRRLTDYCSSPLRELVLAALYTGCRVGELVAMNVQDVARDGYGVYVPPGKTNKARFVYLPDEGMVFFLKQALGKQPNEPLFVNRFGLRWRPSDYRAQIRKAAVACELPVEMNFHVLRHTYASQLVQAGAPFIAVSEQLGHANPVSVMTTYGHLSPQIREAEVRQRFTPVDSQLAAEATAQSEFLREWRESLHGVGHDTYARISDLSSRENTLV